MEKRHVDVVVLSDLHLGTYGSRAKEILTYLKSISPRILILNGDILDIWQISKRYFPPSHAAVLKEVISMLTKGTKVVYITGNHDELLRKYTDMNMGNFQLTDKLIIEIDNKMTWIFHGDVFDNTTKGAAKLWAKMGSNGYAALLLFNKAINYCFKLIGRERVSLSKKVMASVNKAVIRINDFETTAAEIAIRKKYDYVICGHIHQPQKRVVKNEEGSVVYLNSGDWVEHLTSLEYFNNDWHIYTYDEKVMNTVQVRDIESRKETDVVTAEIALYLHSLAM